MKKGFTLVEILVTVAVIAMLAGIVGVNINNARKQAGFTRAKDQIDQIASGAFLYYQDTGTWAPDISLTTGNPNATFYTPQYIDIRNVEPLTYLGTTYKWDWQNWGNYDASGYPNNRTFSFTQPFGNMCWESVDLYREYTPGSFELAMRKCIRDACTNQKYCSALGYCWNTAAGRDAGNTGSPDFMGYYWLASCNSGKGCSAVCEDCTHEGNTAISDKSGCGNKFRP